MFELEITQGRAYRMLEKHLTKLLAKYDLFITDWKVLGKIHSGEDMQPAHLAELLGVKRPFITVLLKKLEDKKLITRVSNEDDKRFQKVTITESGKELFEKMEEDVQILMKQLLKGTNMLEMIAYRNIMKSIIKNGEAIDLST